MTKKNFRVISEKLQFNNTENKSQQETEIISPLLTTRSTWFTASKIYTTTSLEKFETLHAWLQELKVNLTGTKVHNLNFNLVESLSLILWSPDVLYSKIKEPKLPSTRDSTYMYFPDRHDGNCDIIDIFGSFWLYWGVPIGRNICLQL